MTNNADPDQLASSLPTLLAKDGYIRVQQDKVIINRINT